MPGRPTGGPAASAAPRAAAALERRRLFTHAVFGPADPAEPVPGRPSRAVVGTVLDASPHVLVLATAAGEEGRYALAESTRVWRGRRIDAAALRAGQHAVLRRHPAGRMAADRVWADVARVSGVIVERRGEELLVDQGHTRGRATVVVGERTGGRVRVRFPVLEPGYLIDVIGVRSAGAVTAVLPATSQPPYRADHVPPRPRGAGRLTEGLLGTATWYEPPAESPELRGVAYPGVDPDGGCAGSGREPCDAAVSCAPLPILSPGCAVTVRNECTGAAARLGVVDCGATASRFCDRCVRCGTSARGRLAELTVASFVELGGELEAGCFNARVWAA